MNITDDDLIRIATRLVGEFRTSADCVAGGVAAALVTRTGRVFTSVCIDTACSLGFCAGHAAVADMLRSRESEIDRIVAANSGGEILAPCGQCRELLWQVSCRNADTCVLLGSGTAVTPTGLLPQRGGGWRR